MNLNQVTISSLNVEKASVFYKKLGLELIVDALPRYVRFQCPDGASTFSIHKVENLQPSHNITLYFEVENLPKTISDLKEKGINFNSEILEQPWLWNEVHLNDTDGHQLIIYHAGENRKNPPWRIQ